MSAVSSSGDGADQQRSELDERALTEVLTVLEDVGRVRHATDMFLVVSGSSGSEYLVDARDGVCQCPDHQYRERRCKHLRRVAFATGRRPVPEYLDQDDVDDQLGEHVSGTVRREGDD